MRIAAQLKRRIAESTGSLVSFERDTLSVAPAPERVLALEKVNGVPEVKLNRLKVIAEAALSGKLDTEKLRKLPKDVVVSVVDART
jgi:DNA-3-methyladenine glycosylase II